MARRCPVAPRNRRRGRAPAACAAAARAGGRRQGTIRDRARRGAVLQSPGNDADPLRRVRRLRLEPRRFASRPALAAHPRRQEVDRRRCRPGNLRAAWHDQHAQRLPGCDRVAGAFDDDERPERAVEDARGAFPPDLAGAGDLAAVPAARDAAQPLPACRDPASRRGHGDAVARRRARRRSRRRPARSGGWRAIEGSSARASFRQP